MGAQTTLGMEENNLPKYARCHLQLKVPIGSFNSNSNDNHNNCHREIADCSLRPVPSPALNGERDDRLANKHLFQPDSDVGIPLVGIIGCTETPFRASCHFSAKKHFIWLRYTRASLSLLKFMKRKVAK